MDGNRLTVGVFGATGAVGQKLVTMVASHPWFELAVLAASPRSVGRPYGEAVHWLEPVPIPRAVAAMTVQPTEPPPSCDLVLSALDAETARDVEPRLAAAGIPVFSNASAFRQHPSVPIVVPEVNPNHLALVNSQSFGGSFIVTNPNCSVSGLVLALKPLADSFGVAAVQVTTMQALSGAGYPGVSALDAVGNVLPFIAGEEEKIESEPGKILGRFDGDAIVPHDMAVSAQANRVPVLDGHLLSVSVKLGRRAALDEIRDAFESFSASSPVCDLPSAPASPLVVCTDLLQPQPRRYSSTAEGMVVRIGRFRRCSVLDVRFVVLVHNTVRGGAGGAVLNAELAVASGLVAQGRSASIGRCSMPVLAW